MYKNVTDEAKYDIIIPTAANVPPNSVTVLYEYLTERILDSGPENKHALRNSVHRDFASDMDAKYTKRTIKEITQSRNPCGCSRRSIERLYKFNK